MSLWEYKVITSGKGGFATPAMMEKFLNDLGRDEWEIVCFQTAPENFLAFTGLARRSTQRDWTLEDAAAAAAKAEAEKLRAEFEAKFKAAASTAPAGAGGEERAPSFLEEKAAPDDGFRKPVDTSRDDEPEAAEDEKDDWDKLTAAEEDELPTFFEAIKPHMRRNQRGPGMSVGVDYLAKKWDQSEDDIKGALLECGFVMPEDEDTKPEYVEYDGDLYWLNINRRGELWINTKEKPRPVFRPVKATRVEQPEPSAPSAGAEVQAARSDAAEKSEAASPKPEVSSEAAAGGDASAEGKPEAASESTAQPVENRGGGAGRLPEGADLLRKIRPHMRRNRRGPGGSGSTNFLARALRVKEDELKAAFVTLGLTMPGSANDKPVYSEFGNEVWWLNMDSRGGLWINGREKRQGEVLGAAGAGGEGAPAEQEAAGGEAAAPAEAVPGSAAPDGVPAPEVVPSTNALPAEQTTANAATDASSGATAAPVAEAPSAKASEREREVAPMPAEAPVAPQAESRTGGEAAAVLAGVRLLLKETKTGGIAGKIERLAEEMSKSSDDVLATLVGAGLKVPEKPREKPVFVEHGGEIFWINKNARGELWLNAKASKFADKADEDEDGGDDEGDAAEADATEGAGASESGDAAAEKKPRRVRTRRRSE